jgi:hypothetical protein
MHAAVLHPRVRLGGKDRRVLCGSESSKKTSDVNRHKGPLRTGEMREEVRLEGARGETSARGETRARGETSARGET